MSVREQYEYNIYNVLAALQREMLVQIRHANQYDKK